MQLASDMYGQQNKGGQVCFQGTSYKNLNRISPLQNKKTGSDTTLVFIDSQVLSVRCHPEESSTALEQNPVLVTLGHRRREVATGRRLLADDLKETGEIRNRECVRWNPDLQISGSPSKGGWSPDGCSMHNSTADETVCKCTQLGTFAVIAKVRQPFDIPPEEDWLKLCKWIGFGLSALLLVIYMFIIIFRMALHEQFHMIRLNLAGAALGAIISFCLSGFLHGDEDVCRIISMFIHFFYTAVGTWLTAEAHALFVAIVSGSMGGRFTCYIMVGWVIPGGLIGGCLTLFHDYGYDYRCLVGPTRQMRWLLVLPILGSTLVALVFSVLAIVNAGTPAIKRTSIVNELSTGAKLNFIVILLFFITWCCGVFALVDLGFDGGEIPAFNPIFQILNSYLGIFIVLLIGFGSRHFRYCMCNSGKSSTHMKQLSLDPFDIHDRTAVDTQKKIYVG